MLRFYNPGVVLPLGLIPSEILDRLDFYIQRRTYNLFNYGITFLSLSRYMPDVMCII